MSTAQPATQAGTGAPAGGGKVKLRHQRMNSQDRTTVVLMAAIPTVLVLGLVWFPAISSVILSFTDWNGIGPLSDINFIGFKNYVDIFTIYPPFWPALQHNLMWLISLFLIFTPLGMLLAVLVDREIRASRFYQTSFYLPVVLAGALIGFIWQLLFSRDQGLINAVLGTTIDWYGNPEVNIYAAMIANGWRHTGYIMLLYLAGLKGFDPALGEAAVGAGNLAIPLVKQLTAQVKARDPDAARYVHWGATSQDAIDTGLVLQLRGALDAAETLLEQLLAALALQADRYRDTVMPGRTWMQHALPVTFGLKLAGTLDALLRWQQRLREMRPRLLVLQFGGAAVDVFPDRLLQSFLNLVCHLRREVSQLRHEPTIGDTTGNAAGTLAPITMTSWVTRGPSRWAGARLS